MTSRAQLSESADRGGGHTDLMRAALGGDTGTVKRLLESGDVNERDDEGRTALMFAVTNLHTDSAKALLEHGADVNLIANDGSTALMLAASSGDRDIVPDLLAKGADVSAKFTQTGKTALTLAKEKGFTDIVRQLEAAGATE